MENSASAKLSPLQRNALLLGTLILLILILIYKNFYNIGLNKLDFMARNSLPPNIALNNGKPTIIEFYADWCEVCQKMSSDMYDLETKNKEEIDVVLLNVDNERWNSLVSEYEVNGIPQLNLFDSKGLLKGKSIGYKSKSELEQIFNSISSNKFTEILYDNSYDFSRYDESRVSTNYSSKPMSHS